MKILYFSGGYKSTI